MGGIVAGHGKPELTTTAIKTCSPHQVTGRRSQTEIAAGLTRVSQRRRLVSWLDERRAELVSPPTKVILPPEQLRRYPSPLTCAWVPRPLRVTRSDEVADTGPGEIASVSKEK